MVRNEFAIFCSCLDFVRVACSHDCRLMTGPTVLFDAWVGNAVSNPLPDKGVHRSVASRIGGT